MLFCQFHKRVSVEDSGIYIRGRGSAFPLTLFSESDGKEKEREREISGRETDSAFAVAQYRAPGSVKGEITDLLANAGVPLFASSPGVEMMGFP